MSIHPDGEPDDHPGNDSGHSTWVLKDEEATQVHCFTLSSEANALLCQERLLEIYSLESKIEYFY